MVKVSPYIHTRFFQTPPRLPFSGELDLTYRCNNRCRHCWLNLPENHALSGEELTPGEIERLVHQARQMGCRHWGISGGEPMLREDFSDILERIAHLSESVVVNTNGTLVTPAIAGLFSKKMTAYVSLYGGDEQIHDTVTRRDGSFARLIEGLSRLKESHALFMVQVVPMRTNIHQFSRMVDLARRFSPHIRIGASWLHGPADADPVKMTDIRHERLTPEDLSACPQLAGHLLDSPHALTPPEKACSNGYDACITGGQKFHIDPYGRMSFCSFIKDPSFRFSLREGSFARGFDEFLPGLVKKGQTRVSENADCHFCEKKLYCNWCPALSFLEHGTYNHKIAALCDMADAKKVFPRGAHPSGERYYRIAGITLGISSERPITDHTFHPKFKPFETDGPGEDTIFIHHSFDLPGTDQTNGKKEIYRKAPWVVYETATGYLYTGLSPDSEEDACHQIIITDKDHRRIKVYSKHLRPHFASGELASLTLLPTDQILLSQALIHRDACYLHAAGVIYNSSGLLFAGHSDAGKSTITTLFKERATILCDDRMIIRKWSDGLKIHGTWSHGDVADISPRSAPLRAIFFLKQSHTNDAVLMEKNRAARLLIECLIKPLETKYFWEKSFQLVEDILRQVPVYTLLFDKSGAVTETVSHIAGEDRFFPSEKRKALI